MTATRPVVLGLGSNLDPIQYLRKALQALKSSNAQNWIQIIRTSPLYESDALLPLGAPPDWNRPFINFCVLAETRLEPLALLHKLKTIESGLGRKDRERWAPREIDIDILAFDSFTFDHPELTIPHPGLLDRPFALLPLCDLVPDWVIPVKTPNFTPEYTVSRWASEMRKKTGGLLPFQTRRSERALTELVGILNLTPDSFSDGGRFNTPEAALNQAVRLVEAGAETLDLGAESTRPMGAQALSPAEEWNRLEPTLNRLRTHFCTRSESSVFPKVRLSVDTRHPGTARRALDYGVDWINDVSGLSHPEMRRIARDSKADWVFMHSLTLPVEPSKIIPLEEDPVEFLLNWGREQISLLAEQGVSPERLIFDPGIGFGKAPQQSWEILRRMSEFQRLGVRIFAGHSRKSFLSSITSAPFAERDLETSVLTTTLAEAGVDYIRVHDVESNARALMAWTYARAK